MPGQSKPQGRLRLHRSSRRSKAKHFKLQQPGNPFPLKAAFRRPRRCSAASVLPSSKGTTATAGAAVMAIAVDGVVGATSAGDGPTVVGGADATAGQGAICRRQNTLRRRIPSRANLNRTKRRLGISSPSFFPASRSPSSRNELRPVPRRLLLDKLLSPRRPPLRRLRLELSRMRNCPRGCLDRYLQLRQQRRRKNL